MFWYIPAEHEMHATCLVLSWYCPAGHGRQDSWWGLDSEAPTGQSLQKELPVLGLNVPAPHSRQAVPLVWLW